MQDSANLKISVFIKRVGSINSEADNPREETKHRTHRTIYYRDNNFYHNNIIFVDVTT